MQYGHYLKQLFRADLGQSFKFQAQVRRIIFERYPATLQLAFCALQSARPSPFPQASSLRIAVGMLPIAPSERMLVQNDWGQSVECQDRQDSVV